MRRLLVYGDSSVIHKTTEKQGGNVQVQTRAGRFHGAGSWPPALSAILKEVERIFKKRGYFTSSKEVRGVCTSADGSYERGSADDCTRFLKNVGVLVLGVVGGKSRLIIDPTACTLLQSCYERNEQPHFPTTHELETRLRTLLKSLRKRLAKSRTKTKPAIAPVAMPLQTTSHAVAAPPELPVAPTQTQEATQMSAAAAAASPAPALPDWTAKSVPRQRFVAYLPPGAAREVWTFLYVFVTSPGDFGVRIAVPNDKLPDGVECSTAEFDEWLETFVRAGVIERLGESGGDNDAFRFLVHPDEIHTVEIQERKRIKTPKVWIDVANRARREIRQEQLAVDRLRNQLAAWVEGNFPGLLGLTASQKLMGYRPDATRTDTNWGIFYKDPNRDAYLPCLIGLEPYEFVPTDFVARRCKRKGKGVKSTPAREPVIESEVEPVVEEPAPAHADPPARERGDEPEPVPEPTAEAASVAAPLSIKDLRDRICEEEARLEEAVRLLTALDARQERRDELAAELETLDTQIAADHTRLTELGFLVQKES